MKIGIDSRALSRQMCGITRCMTNLVSTFLEIDGKNQYFLFSDKELIYNIKLKDNFKKVIIRSGSDLIWEQFLLPQSIKKHKIDVFHCPQNHGLPYKKDCKFILTVHDIIPRIFPEFWKDYSRLTKLMYDLSLNISAAKADKIITVSNNTRNDVLKALDLKENKTLTIPNGIEEKFKPIDEAEEIYLKKFGITKGYILHIAGIGFNKNSAVVLAAFDKLKNELSFDCGLVIAGKKGLFSKEALDKADSIGNVLFIDYAEDADMPLLYSGASLLLFPSLYEGFGFPVLEAMACGIPVVLSRNSSLPEIAGDAGLYIDHLNADDITQKITSVLRDTALRESLINRGLERVKQFNWKKTASDTLRVYERALS